MAGYYLYTIDHAVFTQLTTAPTKAQGLILADALLGHFDDGDDVSAMWPEDREALADVIVQRLARPDWYSDLSYDDAAMWDHVVFSLQYDPGERIGIDFQCSDYESIYWDCAQIAAKHGATMMAEPAFGNGGFRYVPKPKRKDDLGLMYTLYPPDQARRLLAQLEAVEPHFRSLRDAGEGSPRDQFFEGLLPAVRTAAAGGRVFWVQTDT